MTKKEFLKIKADFEQEEERWKKLKVGETVYIEFPRFFDVEYYEFEITAINVDERYVSGYDNSQNHLYIEKLHGFRTVEELAKQGVVIKD